jgi:hypothetical protein
VRNLASFVGVGTVMKVQISLLAVVIGALVVVPAGSAKGPIDATVTGPGLDKPWRSADTCSRRTRASTPERSASPVC